VRVDIDGILGHPGGELKLNGMFVAGQGQHVDHHTRVDHAASHTTSDEVYKGIADGNGRGVFNGRVLVRKGVEKVAATQASNNLLLSSDAEIDAKPELEIYANDLRCAHGATVGQLDDDSLFYLRSRGVPAVEARALLIYGFVQSLVESIPHPALQALVTARFAEANPALEKLLSGDYS
jgi:Fe-S cluster assembly protein SufD